MLLKEVQQKNMNLIVLFTVGYSGNCLLAELTLEEVVSGLDENVFVYKMDVNNNPKSIIDHGVREYPTILFFKNGQVVDHQIGLISKKELYKKVLKFIKSDIKNILINS